MKEFDLEQAMTGKPVCTRGGSEVRIICFDANRKINDVNYPIVALIQNSDNSEFVRGYTADGKININAAREDSLDLMMKTTKREGWINIYKCDNNPFTSCIFKTKEKAVENSERNYVDTIKIEWEE